MDRMSNAVPDPHQEQPSTVLAEAPPVIETVPNPLEESETLRDEDEKQSVLAKFREDQAELEKQFARTHSLTTEQDLPMTAKLTTRMLATRSS